MSDNDDEQYIAKGCALIRANFHIDPRELTEEEWAQLFSEAVWVEGTRLTNLAKILAKLFETSDNE
ncbi:hypothetical protein [Alistipes dispar]|uniref:hypothetical protein n=1 Tax=Alistipes dispar TaxID=2585119 RepID=UPI00206AC945|nr:hypothetical protein [Alistipes dispar]DAY49919.1 MAG TPA: hypothetical protein [Caudoviricetes sp.]